MTDLLPILHVIDVAHGIDVALIDRRVGRARRSAVARKGWATRRERIETGTAETGFGLGPKDESRASEGGLAHD